MVSLPVDFVAKAQTAAKPGASGYPYTLSAADLMANFHAATLDATSVVNGTAQPFSTQEVAVGPNQKQRTLQLNPPPPVDGKSYIFSFVGGAFVWRELPTSPDEEGTFLLGSESGVLKWIATEEC